MLKLKRRLPMALLIGATAAVLFAGLAVRSHFEQDIAFAAKRAAQGSALVSTPCGPIEYQEAGAGIPLLVVHGSGGGHDQGMAYARPLVREGIRVIAMSRFGYLRTPMPADGSPQAQADAHRCLLDALGIRQAAVLGISAGGPSAMQTAIRHPERVGALVLVVPITYKPAILSDSFLPLAPWAERMLMRLIGSDFLFWAGLHIARDRVIRHVLATPPELLASASPAERARVHAMAESILPVSARAHGLRDDSVLGPGLAPYALESIRAPTLLISARDDGFGTYAGARYTAGRIAGARFIGFDAGGHLLVGHDAAVRAEILKLLVAQPG